MANPAPPPMPPIPEAPPEGEYGGYTESKSKSYNPFTWGKTEKGWNVDPKAFAYETGVPDDWNRGAQQMSEMQFGNDARAQQMQMQQLLMQRAQGQNLASAAMAQQQLGQGQGAINSQAASAMRGGYDPAAQRAALYATGELGGQVAGSAAIAAAQEQMAAAQAAAQSAQGMRGSDITQGLGAQELAMKLRQMGMNDKLADLQARMAQEEAMKAAYMGTETSEGIGPAIGSAAMGYLGYKVGGKEGAAVGAKMGGGLGSGLGNL